MFDDTKERGAELSAGASGRFVIRMPPQLHGLLRLSASEAGISLNEYCILKLSAPGPRVADIKDAAGAVKYAAGLFGETLWGIAVFGSWARGEEAAGSDIDLLVVLDQGTRLSRGLYRRWDSQPVEWGRHRVEPHFVHFPSGSGGLSGVWAEVAMDGIVLHERGLSLSRQLVWVRRRIASGRIVQKVAYGQPYWVEAG